MNCEELKISKEQIEEISRNIQIEDIIKEIKNNTKDYHKYVRDNSRNKLLYIFYKPTPLGYIVDLVGGKDE